MIPFIRRSEISKTNLLWKKTELWLPLRSRIDWKGRKGAFEVWKSLYLDSSGGYMSVHICQNSLNCTFKICVFPCIVNLI